MQVSFGLGRANLYEQVADSLEKQILDNPAALGSKLPSEQELAHGFSVSRPVVREALKLLKERRLVSVRNGEGVFVEKPDAGALASVLQRVVTMDSVDLTHVYGLRLVLEPAACALAAPRVSETDLAQLSALVAQTEAARADHAARMENDYAFHLRIAQLSGNPLIPYFLGSLRELFFALMEPAVADPKGNDRGIKNHKLIVKALATGDAGVARQAMHNHLTRCRADYAL